MFYPTAEVDLSKTEGAISSRACGYLYGLAEEGVPSEEMVKSLDIKSVSQKVKDGLQHPIGDVDHVSKNLDSCDYIVVYLQDSYSTWYYNHKEIEEARKEGTYDCESFVKNDFFPKVKEKVSDISKADYSDRIVYCPYNECDNAVWFGTVMPEGWWAFDDAAKQRFYKAWKETFELIRSIDPQAKIGGPGYCDYDIYEITDFLKYCKDNNCLPDVMIYHELSPISSTYWEDHVREYRQKEKALGLKELPIIITEYGTMEECGAPAPMLHYIQAIEDSNTYANVAYWRLADNLCDTCTDANIPNSNWWLFKWYCDMQGNKISSKIIDLKHSDFANTIKYQRDNFHYTQLEALSAFDESTLTTEILCGGCDYDFQIALKNTAKYYAGKTVRITIEAVTYEGLSGEVYTPATIKEYTQKVKNNFKIKVPSNDKNAVYHVTVKEYKNEPLHSSETLPVRYEFEHGRLLGSAYTYDSAYATTGETVGMCGGFEKIGDGISLDFNVPDGNYSLALVYGNSNDGAAPSDRKDTLVNLEIDGKKEVISLPNTIKSEYTKKYYLSSDLSKGKHNITLTHNEGTFVLDSLLLFKKSDEKIYNKYEEKYKEHLIIVPEDGYYKISSDSSVRYLKRGLNYVALDTTESVVISRLKSDNYAQYSPSDLTLSDGAEIKSIGGKNCITGINSNGGKATFNVTAEKSGIYAIKFTYSNNEEGGYHDYNVDLIEEYLTINANGKDYTLWCVNTNSNYNFNTAVAYLELKEGINEIILYNNGSVKFDNRVATSPDIAEIVVNPAVK